MQREILSQVTTFNKRHSELQAWTSFFLFPQVKTMASVNIGLSAFCGELHANSVVTKFVQSGVEVQSDDDRKVSLSVKGSVFSLGTTFDYPILQVSMTAGSPWTQFFMSQTLPTQYVGKRAEIVSFHCPAMRANGVDPSAFVVTHTLGTTGAKYFYLNLEDVGGSGSYEKTETVPCGGVLRIFRYLNVDFLDETPAFSSTEGEPQVSTHTLP